MVAGVAAAEAKKKEILVTWLQKKTINANARPGKGWKDLAVFIYVTCYRLLVTGWLQL